MQKRINTVRLNVGRIGESRTLHVLSEEALFWTYAKDNGEPSCTSRQLKAKKNIAPMTFFKKKSACKACKKNLKDFGIRP